MRFSSLLPAGLLALAQISSAVPTKTAKSRVVKRATVSDVPDVGYATLNGGTTGGNGGETTTVSSYEDLAAAVEGDNPKIVIVSGNISQAADAVSVGSNTTIIGQGAVLDGFGLSIHAPNVIVRNIAIQNVEADFGDAIGIQEPEATNIWIDHCDLSSNMDQDKDYYDGLLDITHAADFITVSNTKFHDHWKASLVGHSDSNGDEDTGHLRVTYANNHWVNINSRGPSLRFGSGHIINSFYDTINDGINVRSGGQVLVESNVFVGSSKPLYTVDEGGAVANDNDFGEGENTAPEGTLTSVDYEYTLLGSENVEAAVVGVAGATLEF
ncbi:hypothetical protein FQN54_001000 [Arachnomyces sp. PD_36]|nr:hypothetical protein FQN54_001000 [Arachnomyces sp. PD_36]